MSFHLLSTQSADRLMLRISQPKIQWQSWPPQHTCTHGVLRSFTMTATVANTADIRRPTNLERTECSTSDTTIRRNHEDALKTCSSHTRNTTRLPAHVPRKRQNRRPSLESLRPKPMPGEVRAQQRPHVEFLHLKIPPIQ